MSELLKIPGVGKETEKDLMKLGYNTIESLKNADPQQMYDEMCRISGTKLDRCVLYVFRCAVYYAETENPDKEKLKWWNWKD
ncbi:MAG: helix-hairpin-helix domain-containing protein [Clostridia bacterium]|nr:helix-hairpin-helix domain-containing protein [Clostridia bacterium]